MMTTWNNAVGDHKPIPTNHFRAAPPGCSRTGLSYGIRDATDGTSNTIAYAEWLTGNRV